MESLPLYDRLSIRLSADGFSFCSMSRSADGEGTPAFSYTPLQTDPHISLAANVKQLLERQGSVPRAEEFRRTDILMDVAGRYATVPLEMFEDEQTELLFHHLHRQRPGETVLYNILDRSNAVVLFAMDKTAYALLQELFPTARVWAGISPVIEHLTGKSRMAAPRKMYLCPGHRRMDLLVFEHGTPLQAGTYSCRDVNDCIYYTLSVWNSLGLNQEHDELYLIGMEHDEKEKMGEELRKFVRTVSVVNPVAEFNRSWVARHERIPYDLLALWHSGL